MQNSAENRFYQNLYWGQHRHDNERLIRKTNLTLIGLGFVIAIALLSLILSNLPAAENVRNSVTFQVLFFLGLIVWTTLFTSLLFPSLFAQVLEKMTRSKQADFLCREIALNQPLGSYKNLLNDPVLKFRKDGLGKSAIFYLCRTNKAELALAMLQEKPQLVNQTDDLGETPFIEALRAGHKDLIRKLLVFKPTYRNGFTPLMKDAAILDEQSFNESLLRHGDAATKLAYDGTSCALIASRARSFEQFNHILRQTGQCGADQYGDHPADWIIHYKNEMALKTFLDVCGKDKYQIEFLDSNNSSFLHKTVQSNWPHGTQLFFQKSNQLAVYKDIDRKTPADLAAAQGYLQPHLAILNNTSPGSGAGNAGSSPASQSFTPIKKDRPAQGPSLDQDQLEVELEVAFANNGNGSGLIKKLAADLVDFYKGTQSHLQLWTGPVNTGKMSLARQLLEVLNKGSYSGVFFPHLYLGYKHANNVQGLLESFFDPSAFPDNSVIVIEGADGLFDPKSELISSGTQNLVLRQLDHLKDERKIFFILVGSFKERTSGMLSGEDRRAIFGTSISQLMTVRFFHPPAVTQYLDVVWEDYKAQSIRLEDEAFFFLAEYCVSHHISKDAFLVILKELNNLHESAPQAQYTVLQVQKFLESR